jgi:ATP-dependent exoDNAse (exonuclease V) alpha subunit
LSKCRRSDDELFNLCKFENIEIVTKDTFNNKFTFKHVCFTHKKRIEINDKIMNEIKRKKIKNGSMDFVEIKRNVNDEHSQDVILTSCMPIIAHINCKEKNIINNDTFTIMNASSDGIRIKNDHTKQEIVIKVEDFQRLFYVAYAMTSHSVQGQSFDCQYTIHEWEKMDAHMKYVCLTRARTKNQINII